MVAINELILGVQIALDQLPLEACASFDDNGDGVVALNELILAVNAALSGCIVAPTPTPTPTPPVGSPTSTSTGQPSPTPTRRRPPRRLRRRA